MRRIFVLGVKFRSARHRRREFASTTRDTPWCCTSGLYSMSGSVSASMDRFTLALLGPPPESLLGMSALALLDMDDDSIEVQQDEPQKRTQ